MHNPATVLENNTHKLLWDFHINGSPNLGQKTRPNNNQTKRREISKLSTLLSRLTTKYN